MPQEFYPAWIWFVFVVCFVANKSTSGQTKKSDLGPPKKVAFWKGKSPKISEIFQVGEILQFGIRFHESSNRIPSTQADPFQRLKPQDQLRIGEVAPW